MRYRSGILRLTNVRRNKIFSPRKSPILQRSLSLDNKCRRRASYLAASRRFEFPTVITKGKSELERGCNEGNRKEFRLKIREKLIFNARTIIRGGGNVLSSRRFRVEVADEIINRNVLFRYERHRQVKSVEEKYFLSGIFSCFRIFDFLFLFFLFDFRIVSIEDDDCEFETI